jgi:uncharacterized membrane protein
VFSILGLGTALGVGCDVLKRRKMGMHVPSGAHVLIALFSVIAGTLLINIAVHFGSKFMHFWSYLPAILVTWLVIFIIILIGLGVLSRLLKSRRSNNA